MPKTGETAPDFTGIATDGKEISLSSLKGQKVVLYFYPKDDTPGCTKEACDLRDKYADVKKYATVIGVSRDDVKSHVKFTEKHNLPFPLIADTDGSICQKYGTWKEKSMFGKKYMGVTRSTFIINEEGIITKVWEKVNPLTHIKDVLSEISK